MTKEELYAVIKDELVRRHCTVNPFRPIQYGIQFLVFLGETNGLVRIYQNKKGVRVDLSQINSGSLLFQTISDAIALVSESSKPIKTRMINSDRPKDHTADPDMLVGVDESGKGDYFGPLVIAGVYVDPSISKELRRLGVKDSKSLSEQQVRDLEASIRDICPYSVVILNNLVYNDVYGRFPNLNNILAWGHGRVIENMINQKACQHVLCDQFGHQSLIQNALLLRGIDVTLLQRHRAEDNVAVAAASIMARSAYVQAMAQLTDSFKIRFPKGCPPETFAVRAQFIERYGEERLGEVAKLHFKISE